MRFLGPNFLLNAQSNWAAGIGVFLEPKSIWGFSPYQPGLGSLLMHTLSAVKRPCCAISPVSLKNGSEQRDPQAGKLQNKLNSLASDSSSFSQLNNFNKSFKQMGRLGADREGGRLFLQWPSKVLFPPQWAREGQTGEMRRGGEGLGGKDHAELRKKKLRGDTRMDKSHSSRENVRGGRREVSPRGKIKRLWSPVEYKRTLEEREESMQQVSLWLCLHPLQNFLRCASERWELLVIYLVWGELFC